MLIYVTTHHFEPTTGQLNSINRNGEITSYSYDTQNRVNSIEITGQHKQLFSYDNFDRVTNIREEIGSNIYNRETAYDALGRVKKETYPSGYYTINHYDNDYGFLTEVKDKYGHQLWKVNSENARGQITEVQRGGKTTKFGFDSKGLPTGIKASGIVNLNYDFGNDGNLNYRIDSLMGQKEVFVYDGMNRLTNWNIYQNNVLVKPNSIVYNATTGTITSKSDLGNFTMNYGENGKPHALTSIEGVPANFPTDSLNVTYTDFKKIKTLTEGNKHYILTYGIDDQRRKSEYKLNGITQKTKYYLGDYEEETDNLGNIKKIHYLSGGAILINTNGVETLYYGYSDYQGNLIALANESGTVIERYAYDPWGKRRNPSDWTQDDTRTSWIVSRGYTMHEHLDAFSIINMNGRVYDPLTASFFSPDPFVQAPGNWLNFNRYAYCYGNPFKYTDPSGELVWFVPVIIGAVIGATSGYMIGHANGATGWDMVGYIAGGALIGGLSGGAAVGVSALGGGAMLAGAAAGAIGGGGFSGLATGWNGEAMLKGAAFGAISGLVGGGFGSAIGGGWGALAGGAASNLTSQLLYNGGDFSSVNWASVGVSGAASFGLYHGMQYMQYRAMNGKLGQLDVTYKQFSKINTAYQRSRFWQKEYGVYLNKDGSARFVPPNDRHKLAVVFDDWKKGDFSTAHTHWAKEGTDVVIGTEAYTTVGGYHSPQDLNIPGYSLVVGRNSSTYSIGGTGLYNYINPDPFIRFFMFPWKW